MRRLVSLFVFALFAGCASANNDADGIAPATGDAGAAGDSSQSGGGGEAAGTAGTSASGGAGGDETGGKAGTLAAGGDGGGDGGDGGSEAAGAGGDTSAGTGGTGGSAGKGGSAGGNACAGVTCNAPPPKVCKNANELTVYTSPGSCNNGSCSYVATTIACEKGCQNDSCVGNPCLGVSCSKPPAPSCVGAQDLLSYDNPGSCAEGSCTYPDKKVFCQFGCENGQCKGNPCSGKVCAAPPASYCSAADKLTIFAGVGTCDAVTGDCAYQSQEEFCAFGCVNGACNGDPCVGVSCVTPPAPFCSGPTTRKVGVSPGTCNGGGCTYTSTDQPCPFGCVNGACKDCAADTDCKTAGTFCDAGTCRACDGDLHCGPSCTNCASTAQVCSAGACVACVTDAQCGGGKFCEGSVCKACDTSAKCGASCQACGATTPTCAGGTTCACTETSCGANNRCVAGACEACVIDAACGPSCAACGGATPICKATGGVGACVECTTNEQCGPGKTCTPDNKCVAGCPPPAEACTTGNQNKDRCTGARIIGRKAAAGGVLFADNTCGASNRSDQSGNCYDAGDDHHYRLYMRKGESANIAIVAKESCPSYQYSDWDSTLKIFQPAACSQGVLPAYTDCGTRTFCDDYFNGKNTTYVAPEDGWVVIVVDGSSAFDDEGDYELTVKLTCSTGTCECP